MAPRLAPGKWRKALRMIEKWLQTDLRPNCRRIDMLLLLLGSHEDLGLLPTSENAETLESTSTHQTQKSPESFSQIADPRKTPPWGSTLSLKALRCPWREYSKIQPQTPPKISNGQGLAPCSISEPESSEQDQTKLPTKWTASSLSGLRSL